MRFSGAGGGILDDGSFISDTAITEPPLGAKYACRSCKDNEFLFIKKNTITIVRNNTVSTIVPDIVLKLMPTMKGPGSRARDVDPRDRRLRGNPHRRPSCLCPCSWSQFAA